MNSRIAFFTALTGMILSGISTAATTTPAPTIRISPATIQLRAGEHTTFYASATGITAPATVTWKVLSTASGSTADLGTVTSAGVYTAPAAVPSPNTVLVQASDSANASVLATSTVTILSPLPAITSLSEYNVNTGLGFTLTIRGTNFLAGAKVLLDGTETPSTVVAGALVVSGKSSAAVGSKISVAVANPGPSATSGAWSLTVIAPVAVHISPADTSVRVGKTQQFYAGVSNNSNTAATWQVNTKPGGDTTVGTIDSKGLYTAPATLPSGNVSVTAVSVADPTASASSPVTLENTVPVISTLTPSTVNTGLAYTVDVIGTGFLSTSKVLLDGVAVPATFVSSTKLTIAGTSALAAGKTIAVTVSSPGPNAVSGARSLTVLAPVAVTVSPDKQTTRIGQTRQFSSHVANNTDQAVAWKVNGVTSGNTTWGTIDDKGLYTPPVLLPVNPVLTVSAVSHADPTASASVTLTLENGLPVITGVTPNPVHLDTTTITLTGAGFAKGSVISFGGVSLTTTFVSDTKLTASTAISMPLGRVASVKVINPNPGSETSAPVAVPVRLAPAAEKMSYADAVRFLEMASWGPRPGDVAHLQAIGRDAWLQEQLALPATALPDPNDPNEGAGRLQDAFFTNALTGSDQLRQRVAFALGHILVVAAEKDTHFAQMVSYQRVLLADAFGNFRTLLGDITLNPAMGFFLDMVNNVKANPVRNTVANENYAREVMQLFTVGLNQLDGNGVPIPGAVPEYDQSTVTEMAKVFTGWTYPPVPGFASHWNNPEYYDGAMVPFDAYHDTTAKNINLPLACSIPAGGSAANDLKLALDCLTKQTNVSPFISYRLIQELVTSNPSPAYVGRVANVFSSSGGRLDLVIRAILTDSEAMGTDPAAPPTSKLREPVLYATTLLRALNATVTGDATGVRGQTAAMGQDVLDAPSVFSYFSPFFKVAVPNFPSPLAVTVTVAPEFQLVNAETAFGAINFAYRATVNAVSGNIRVDFGNLQDLAGNEAVVLDAIDQALYRGQMTADEKTAVLAGINASADHLTRVRDGFYVAAAAPQYQVQR